MSELIQIGGVSRPTEGKKYWRGLMEAGNEWLHREFPSLADTIDGSSRRTVLKLMGASFGLAGLTACSRPVEHILPASRSVEGQVPGKAVFYATAMPLGGFATGLLAETHDGRPTKIEGNPTHPFSRGAASSFHQASVLGLYDPDRTQTVLKNGVLASWDEFTAWAAALANGARLRFLSHTVNSPSLEAVRSHALERFRQARWIEYEPITRDEELAGSELAFGKAVQPVWNLAAADVIVSLDADFLGLDSPALSYSTDFARRRRAEGMNRLYVAESQLSVTGGMADHRWRMRAGAIAETAAELAGALGVGPARAAKRPWVAAVARDLKKNAGRSLVIAGPRQPAAVHALVHRINHALGNAGRTVTYVETARRPQVAGLKELAGEMAAGQVDALVILGGNPAYDAPADLNFAAAMKKVPVTAHLAAEPNETAALATWQLPEAHYLEAWGDARALDGTVSIQQPMIEPLYGGKSAAEVAALVAGYPDQRGYDIVHNYWRKQLDEEAWRKALDAGVVAQTTSKPVELAPIGRDIELPRAPGGGIEINFYPSAATWDGRFANNGWMQEAPEPVTRLTWDNAALVSPATARKLGVKNGDLIAIASAGREMDMPVWIQPGHADGSVSLALGYGRRRCGRVGNNVGHNTYALRTAAAMWMAGGTVRKTGRQYPLSTTQHHHSMEGRPIVREATLEEYHSDPQFAKAPDKDVELGQLFPAYPYDKGNQWGMAIDLNACIGCNACVLACQAENNIPIVGKEQVAKYREMHWIRVDRYYTGPAEDPRTVTQPVNCQQCENAPCESVCPVAATSHSPEGLNDMAYNRCVGTRYCSNNCPYKVRRFNFLNYHKDLPEVEKMVYNPDVTVRMRGVMEKCTYCVQRIQEGKIRAKLDGHRPIKDGEIRPACQQTCPAEAIVFGNILDKNSRVAKLKKSNRNYTLLDELNTRPRTSYLARLRNPNPELA